MNIHQAAPKFAEASAAMSHLGEQAGAISEPSPFSALRDARIQLQALTSDITVLLEVKFLLEEPTTPGAPRVPVQPSVDNVTPVVSVPECS